VNDLAAVGVLAAADDYPSAVAVTGYDNSSVAQLRRVSLTSVDPHNAEIGVQAARRILEAEEGLAAAEPETLVPPALVPRASTHATRRAGP
jgi:DNA-binding LacI/PurR family transcriptional regulator